MSKAKRSQAKSKKSAAGAPSQPLVDLPAVSGGLFPPTLLENEEVWSTFLTQNKEKLGVEEGKIEEMMGKSGEYLRNLAKRVNELGGWLEITRKDAWSDATIDKLREPRLDYENYLFPILKYLEFQHKYPTSAPYTLSPCHLRPSTLRPIKVFTPPDSGLLTQAFWDQVFAEDIAILRGFPTKVWRFDHSLFTFEYLKTHHGSTEIEVLMQDKDPDKDILRLHEGRKVKSTILDYINSHVIAGQCDTKVPFAVNIDIGSWSQQMDQYHAKLPEYLLFCSDFDSLNHLRVHVNGMSLPQIYLKVAGCWTGAHQENLSFAALNLNHGPGECQWWGIAPADVGNVRAEVGEKMGFDVAKNETLWWPDENWVLSKGYGCYYGVQRPDDLVYVGPGTLHWVKTIAPTVNSSWNIGPKTLKQFEAAYARNTLNETIGVESIIQINTLAMDLINNELASLPIDLIKYLTDRLKEQFDREKSLLEAAKLPMLGVFPGHQMRRCESCKREILYAYAVSIDNAYCLKCASSLSLPNSNQMFSSDCFQRLLDRVQRRIAGETVDFYDLGLNLHFTKGMRQRISRAWVSPFSGFPSLISFTIEPAKSDVEMSETSPSTPVQAKNTPEESSIEGENRPKRTRKAGKKASPTPKKHPKKSIPEAKSPSAEPISPTERRCATRSQMRREEPEEVEEEQKPMHRGEPDATEDSQDKADSNNSDVPRKASEKTTAKSGKGQDNIPRKEKC